MTALKKLLLILVITHASFVKSDDFFDLGSPYFHSVDAMESLGTGTVTSMIQDQDGYIWLGTQKGLARFDGYQFKVFKHEPENPNSIAGNYIRTIWQTPDAKLWVGTFYNGLSIIDLSTGKITNVAMQSESNNHSLSDNQVRALYGDEQGNVYIGTNNGLDYYNASTKEFAQIDVINGCETTYADKKARSLFIDSTHSLWLGTNNGVCRIEKPAEKLSDSKFVGTEYAEFFNETVYELFEANNGDIWIGTIMAGAAKIDVSTQSVHWVPLGEAEEGALNHGWVQGFTQFDNGELWVGTYGGGINVVDPLQMRVTKVFRNSLIDQASINADVISTFLVDTSGLLWIGLWGGGINTYSHLNHAFSFLQSNPLLTNQLSSSHISAVSELSNGQLWAGTVNGVINIIEPAIGVTSQIHIGDMLNEPTFKSMIRVIREFEPGKIWIGTNEGLFHFDHNSQEMQVYNKSDGLENSRIHSLAQFGSVLWIGSGSGVARFDLNSDEDIVPINPKPSQLVYALEVSDTGDIWAATSEGLFVIPKDSTEMIEISENNQSAVNLEIGVIRDLLFDRDGQLWVASSDGLKRMIDWRAGIATFESVSEKVGLGSKNLGSNLNQDAKGNIWTQSYKINPDTWTAEKLKREYGFHLGGSSIGADAITKKGVIIQSGRQGMLMMKPEHVYFSDFHAPVVITDIEINGKSNISNEEVITLSPQTKRFSVTFSSLDYAYPELNQYQYKLEGYDEDWHSASVTERKATYSRLPPGEYVLKVRATNSFGKWSESDINQPIHQVPHWYETWWFKIALFLAVLLFINAIYRLRIKYLKEQKAQLNTLVQSRTKNIESLGKTGQEITASLNLEDIFESVYQHVSESMDAYVFVLGVLDEDKRKINIEFYCEDNQRCPPFSFDMDDTSRPAVECVKHKREIITKNLNQLTEYLGEIKAPVSGSMTESLVYIPLVVKDDAVGCLSVQSMQKNAYDFNHLYMLRTIASYTAIAIENAMAMRQLKSAMNRLQETQQQLVESEKVASLGRLVSGVAHELNTPVGIAITSVSSLGELATQVKEDIEKNKLTKSGITKFVSSSIEIDRLLQKNLGRCANLIKNFKSISADQMTSSPSELTLQSYIQKIVDAHNVRLEEAGISCTVEGDNVTVFVDAGLVGQVVGNLIDNAIHHAFHESALTDKRVHIKVEDSESHVSVLFSDNGVGMDEEQKASIFDPFYTTARNRGLHGLGLNIVHTIIVTKLNGSITVTSEKDQGTSFEMMIPKSSQDSAGAA